MSNGKGSGGERLLSLQEVAGLLSVSKRHIQRLISGGMLPQPVKVGACSRMYLSDVEGFLEHLRKSQRGE